MQTTSADQLVGRTLGQYHIEHLLGYGQLSMVYVAQHISQRRTVMITTFKLPDQVSAQQRERFSLRFAQEGAALVGLAHPNILPTDDFGEQWNYPYLVTPIFQGASLAQVLKQQTRLTLKQTLDVLRQLAAGLDYAHSHGVSHGLLSLSHAVMNNELTVQIAGFGLKMVLAMYRNTQSQKPQAHLFDAADVFLGSADSIAPERVMGMPTDARADIYALGVLLFALLSGEPPFRGSTPFETALRRLQQPVPSIHAVCPDVPEGLDLVIYKALERDPALRYQHAGEVVAAFERTFTALEAMGESHTSHALRATKERQVTLPPTVNWLDEMVTPSSKWQLMPPIITGRMPIVTPFSRPEQAVPVQPGGTATTQAEKNAAPPQAGGSGDSLVGADPFVWWSTTRTKAPSPVAETLPQRPPVRLASIQGHALRQPNRVDRRRAVTLIFSGTATAGVLAVGGLSFARFLQSMKQSQATNAPTAGSTERGTKSPAKPANGSHTTPTTTKSSHTGMAIGATDQQSNSAAAFRNPADGQESLLIRLPDGRFVACERACTHQGVPVNYDPASQRLICPAHGSIFDPAHGFSVVLGPANRPLATVSVHVNGDGTITTG